MMPSEFAPIVNHLWQSTCFTGVAALLTLGLQRNQARVRYAIWLAASYKFLIPFSWLVRAGSMFPWRSAPTVVPSTVTTWTSVVSAPLMLVPKAAHPLQPDHISALTWLIPSVWACGFALVTGGWVREWLRIHALLRTGTPLALDLPIRAVSVTRRLEPGVFGIFRPVLLWPDGIAQRLTADQLQGVLSHEMSHVRRRDNLAAAVHTLVEALFWFHPVVWWLDARIVDERERACDEDVLRLGGEPVAYARTILTICRSYIDAPTACMSGISGADLQTRIVRIMTPDLVEKLTLGRKTMLLAGSIAAFAVPLVFGAMSAPLLGAQGPAAWEQAAGGTMKFEVASVKEQQGPPTPGSGHVNVPMTTWDFPPGVPTGGLYSACCLPFDLYLGFAYKLQGYAGDDFEKQLPNWAKFGGKRYDIEARAAGNPTTDQYRLMMQSLLADRFKLAVHWEMKQMPVLALVLAKPGTLGPRLRVHVDGPPCPDYADVVLPQSIPAIAGGFPLNCGVIAQDRNNVSPGHRRNFARNVSMGNLAVTLDYALRDAGKPVIDKTGLTGNYDLVFEYTSDNSNQPQADGIRLTDALKDDLGLKLEPATAPVAVLVLDHVEEPSTN